MTPVKMKGQYTEDRHKRLKKAAQCEQPFPIENSFFEP